jgi:cobalamin synthase
LFLKVAWFSAESTAPAFEEVLQNALDTAERRIVVFVSVSTTVVVVIFVVFVAVFVRVLVICYILWAERRLDGAKGGRGEHKTRFS